jgi:hypothetical protein
MHIVPYLVRTTLKQVIIGCIDVDIPLSHCFVEGHLQERNRVVLFFEFSLCLSRACLGNGHKHCFSHLPLLLRVDAVVCIVMVMVVTATHSACENRISF